MKKKDESERYVVPISVKGILIENGSVWLRKNERQEWELPGGKLDKGEQPEDAVCRELWEELGFTVVTRRLVSAQLYKPAGKERSDSDESRGVLVLIYLCDLETKSGSFELQGEAGDAEFRSFKDKDLSELKMPDFYKNAIYEVFDDHT